MKIVQKPIACILAALLAVIPATSCSRSNPASSPAPKADIVLTGTENDVTSQLVGQYDALAALAQEPGKSISIAVAGPSDEPVIIKLSFNPDGKPMLTRPDGDQAMLELGLDGFTPVIRLVEVPSGKILSQSAIEASVAAKISRGEKLAQTDWIKTGIIAVGVAIAAWIGIKALGLAVVGIGYLAMAAIVVGAVVIAGGFVSNVFAAMGWSAEDLVNLFRQSYADLAEMIAGAIEKFQEVYNL